MLIESWVWWTVLAALMQAVRTAGQKHLSKEVTPLAATLARYLYGLPFALVWFLLLVNYFEPSLPKLNSVFLFSGLVAGVFQIAATTLLIRLFTLRNFAIGSTYVKSEVLLTALLAFTFFGEEITFFASMAMFICVLGLVIISLAKAQGLHGLWSKSAVYGLSAGLCFALTSLFLRQASLSLDLGERTDLANMMTASMTLLYMVTLQTIMTFLLVTQTQKGEINLVLNAWRPGVFVGITSVLGSIGWFTAMTLEMASFVKTLGQIEFIFTLIIAIFYFKEKPSSSEFVGMVFIVFSAMMLLLRG